MKDDKEPEEGKASGRAVQLEGTTYAEIRAVRCAGGTRDSSGAGNCSGSSGRPHRASEAMPNSWGLDSKGTGKP